MANESLGISPGTYSLDKSKIKFLLPDYEGARRILHIHRDERVSLLRELREIPATIRGRILH